MTSGRRKQRSAPQVDPVLAMVGVGKEIWRAEPGDAFIARLRRRWRRDLRADLSGQTPKVLGIPGKERSPMRRIHTAWDAVQQKVRAGLQVQHWSKDSGDLDGRFKVEEVLTGRLEISSKQIRGRRRIRRADFEAVAAEWPAYVAGRTLRRHLRDSSRNSTYIISLLHWLDSR